MSATSLSHYYYFFFLSFVFGAFILAQPQWVFAEATGSGQASEEVWSSDSATGHGNGDVSTATLNSAEGEQAVSYDDYGNPRTFRDDFGNVQQTPRDEVFSTFGNPNQRGSVENQQQLQATVENTLQQLQRQAESIERQIQQIDTAGQRDVVSTPSASSVVRPVQESPVCTQNWQRDLTFGSTGADVRSLQQFLNEHSEATQVASEGAGSPGQETEYFGQRTADAVARFQEFYATDILAPSGLQSSTQYFGPNSRAKVANLCRGGSVRDTVSTPAVSAPSVVEESAASESVVTEASSGLETASEMGGG
jgi:hypothetical protein